MHYSSLLFIKAHYVIDELQAYSLLPPYWRVGAYFTIRVITQ
jgi:hypothetical protein